MTNLGPSVAERGTGNPTAKATKPKAARPKTTKKAKPKREKKNRATETMSIPEAGAKYYGLSKNGSYDAAARGDFPTIPVGRLRKVPVKMMDRIMAGEIPWPPRRA